MTASKGYQTFLVPLACHDCCMIVHCLLFVAFVVCVQCELVRLLDAMCVSAISPLPMSSARCSFLGRPCMACSCRGVAIHFCFLLPILCLDVQLPESQYIISLLLGCPEQTKVLVLEGGCRPTLSSYHHPCFPAESASRNPSSWYHSCLNPPRRTKQQKKHVVRGCARLPAD